MDIEKITVDFEKRFSKKCEKICFCGMPLTILKGEELVLSAALSAGGCAAAASRSDGRFTAEFDGNGKYISENVAELEYHTAEPMLGFLRRLEWLGAKLCGMDVLFEYNTAIYKGYEPLLLSLMYGICRDMPLAWEAAACLSAPKRDIAAVAGVKNALLLHGEKKDTYVKFSDSAAKIVLCKTDGKNRVEKRADKAILKAVKSLSDGDYLKFGQLVTAEYAEAIKAGGITGGTKSLFELAVNLKDSFGCGILEDGGIFAFAENKKVNAFIQNIKKEYENYCGTAPDFYITRTENSGIYGIKRNQ